jgi:flavin reductase
MTDSSLFRDGMARLGAAVTLITTDGPAGRHGFTATAVCSVTDTPPTLLVCINRDVRAYEAILANGILGVNVLAADHQALSNAFADRALGADERFARAEWRVGASGVPLLDGAGVAFECELAEAKPVGTHDVLFCRVLDVRLPDRRDGLLVWHERRYRALRSELPQDAATATRKVLAAAS